MLHCEWLLDLIEDYHSCTMYECWDRYEAVIKNKPKEAKQYIPRYLQDYLPR